MEQLTPETVKIISASELSSECAEKLEKAFRAKHSGKVVFEYHLNPDLIGGVMVVDGADIFDGTVKGHLSRLKKEI